MTEIKAHEFDGFLKRGLRDYRMFLVYGPDRGLVSERAGEIVKRSGVSQDDPFSFMRLDGPDIASDPGRLFDEINSTGLFGGEKLLWIKGVGADKALADALAALDKDPPTASWLVIEAGDLKKGVNLRKAAEAARSIVAIPCYADDAKALNALIDEELASFQLRIEAEARQALVESLGGDRLASRGEIRKLALYAMGEETITHRHVLDIVGDASATSIDDAVDAVLSGNRSDFLGAVQKVIASKTPVFLVLQGCLRQLQLIDIMRSDMEEGRMNPAEAVAIYGRHLHFRRKPIIENAVKAWRPREISIEMQRLQATILNSRRRPALEDTIAMHSLLATTLVAERCKMNSRR